MLVQKKTVRKIGGSLYINLPRDWTQEHNIEHGTVLTVFSDKNVYITVTDDADIRKIKELISGE